MNRSRPAPRPDTLLYVAFLSLVVVVQSCGETVDPRSPVPAALELVSGDTQSGKVGQELPVPLVARLEDADGVPIPGWALLIEVVAGGGTTPRESIVTNAEGVVEVRWTLGTSTADSQALLVSTLPSDVSQLSLGFSATAVAGAVVRLAAVEGDSQIGLVGAQLPVDLRARALDRFGNPVPAARVAFATSSGSVSPDTATTDSGGDARATLILPTSAGPVVATATLDTIRVSFSAVAAAGAVAQLVKTSGDDQAGAVNTPLPVLLEIEAKDEFDNPVSGIPVTFAAAAGGAFSPPAPVTDSLGIAGTRYTLPPSAGSIAVTATVDTLQVVFAALAIDAPNPDVTVTITQPGPDSLVGDTAIVVVSVNSTFQIDSVRATLEDRTAQLAVSPGQGWLGTILLSGLPFGEHWLTVTAVDVFGNQTQVASRVIYDPPPTVRIYAPLNWTIARPSMLVRAGCSDNEPGCTLRVRVGGSDLITDADSIDTVLTMPNSGDGQFRGLFVFAKDSRNQEVFEVRQFARVTTPAASEIATVPGLIKDVTADRILYVADSMDVRGLTVRDRNTGIDQLIWANMGVGPAFLTPTGAIFVNLQGVVLDWNNGQLLNQGVSAPAYTLKVAGGYAIWSVNQSTLMRRDLAAGTNVAVSTNASNTANDVAGNGDVVYWSQDYQVFRYRSGVSQQLTSAPANFTPVTDGSLVVFERRDPLNLSSGQRQVVLFSDSGLTDLTPFGPAYSANARYAVTAGWVGYPCLTSNQWQVCIRDPTGLIRQASFFSIQSHLKALGANGELVYTNSNGRFYARPDYTQFTDVGDDFGQAYWQGGRLFVIVGRSIFELQ